LSLEQRLSSAIFPDAEIHLLDADHFALDEKNDERASLILMFLVKHRVRQFRSAMSGDQTSEHHRRKPP